MDLGVAVGLLIQDRGSVLVDQTVFLVARVGRDRRQFEMRIEIVVGAQRPLIEVVVAPVVLPLGEASKAIVLGQGRQPRERGVRPGVESVLRGGGRGGEELLRLGIGTVVPAV